MSLAGLLKSKNIVNGSRIYIAPNIPKNLLGNAIVSFGDGFDANDIVVLIDNTMLGSAKDGCIICENRIVFREPFSDPVTLFREEIAAIFPKGKKIFINDKKAFSFNMPNENEIVAIFDCLGLWLNPMSANNLVPHTQSSIQKNSELSDAQLEILVEIIKESAKKIHHERVYVQPNIPLKKLNAAIDSYGMRVDPRNVVVLIDDTVLGGSKEGMMITSKTLLHKTVMQSGCLFFLNSIESIVIEGRDIFVNSKKIGQFTQLKDKDIGVFIDEINLGLGAVRRTEPTLGALLDNESLQQDFPCGLEWESIEFPVDTKSKAKAISLNDASVSDSSFSVDDSFFHGANELEIIDRIDQDIFVNPNGNDSKNIGMTGKMIGVIFDVIDKNKSKILPLVVGKTGDFSVAAINNDENIIKIAKFVYALLPGIVRFAIGEDLFIGFILKNKEPVVVKLTAMFDHKISIPSPSLDAEYRAGDEVSRNLSEDDGGISKKKNLASFKGRKPKADTSVFCSRSVYFPSVRKEMEEFIAGYNGNECGSSDKDGDILRSNIVLILGVLKLSMDFSKKLNEQSDLFTDREISALQSDNALVEIICYCMASIGWMLHSEADFDREEVSDFLVPVMGGLLMPYLERKIDAMEEKSWQKDIDANVRYLPNAKLNNSQEFGDSQSHILALSEALMARDKKLVAICFSRYILASLDDFPVDYVDGCVLNQKLFQTQTQIHIVSLLEGMDRQLELLAVDFLENKEDV